MSGSKQQGDLGEKKYQDVRDFCNRDGFGEPAGSPQTWKCQGNSVELLSHVTILPLSEFIARTGWDESAIDEWKKEWGKNAIIDR